MQNRKNIVSAKSTKMVLDELQPIQGRLGFWTLLNCRTGRYLHSRVNPEAEAEQWVAAQGEGDGKKPRRIAIYGFGLGYHVAAAARFCPGVAISVFDLDYRPFDLSMQLNLLLPSSVSVYTGERAEAALLQWLDKYTEADAFWVHRPSLDLLQDRHVRVRQILEGLLSLRQSYQRFGAQMWENWLQNEPYRNGDLALSDYLTRVGNPTAVVVLGTGPSLDPAIPYINRWREKALVLAAGSALKPLIRHGKRSDAVVISDPQHYVLQQVDVGDQPSLPPLLYLPTVHPAVLQAYGGERFVVAQDGMDYVADWAKSRGEVPVLTGGSVLTLALGVALRTKARKVLFAGADFAYTHGRRHAAHSHNYDWDATIPIGESRTVEANDGGFAVTTQALDTFRLFVEGAIRRNPEVTFFNTGTGAKIEGAKWLPFDQVENELSA
ncbi:DUF115 domain-containing protein [Heliobacterium undosum]|uniref:DUF115 domain-containing protein n=1 Tax=Heliomicrobium undosum TaxID=121734 RepID=A0A845L373_9FIRM|nr:6-hydroxymethylpterin diphosphokinase MptE-like protein [Heliomicrobium undosum]MZP29465.1 DUF115 domain-containing protein [Heliomicrobium undosum]